MVTVNDYHSAIRFAFDLVGTELRAQHQIRIVDDLSQCRNSRRDQLKLSDFGFKGFNALVLLRRRLTVLLLQSLSCFGVFSLGLKLLLFVVALELK